MTCSVEGCTKEAAGRGLCKTHHARLMKGQDPSQKSRFEKTHKERFFEKIEVRGENDCWPWIGSKDQKGYGLFRYVTAKIIRSHRYMHMITVGDIPAKHLVCHTCDNPACCNPKHLFLGTDSDNMIDMVKKGRNTPGKWSNKLSVSDVLEIRKLAGTVTARELAGRYGVQPRTIVCVIQRINWKHI